MNKQKTFTLIEMLVVIGIIGVLAAMLGGPIARAMRSAKLTQCVNNLKQIGLAINMYDNNFGSVPLAGDKTVAANAAKSTSLQDGKLTSANMMRLFVAGLCENLQGFACPLTGVSPADAKDNEKNTVEIVRTNNDGNKLTDYNLTTGYLSRDESNRIIAADSPGLNSNKKWSIHDVDQNNVSPTCLSKAGNVKTEMKLAPDGSSEAMMKGVSEDKKSIYDTASGGSGADKITAGFGKDTFIQPTGAGIESN